MRDISKRIYDSLYEGTLLQTYIEITDDPKVSGFQGKNVIEGYEKIYSEYFEEGFRQYFLDKLELNDAEWKKRVIKYVRISDEEFWKHYYPFYHALCYGVTALFGRIEKTQEELEFEKMYNIAFSHAKRHYNLEQIFYYPIGLTEQMLKNNDINYINKNIDELIRLMNYRLSFFFNYRKKVEYVDDVVNIKLRGYPYKERTIGYCGIEVYFKLKWLIEH